MPSVAVDEFFSCPFSLEVVEAVLFSEVAFVFGVWLCLDEVCSLFAFLGLNSENVSEKFESSFINLSISSEFLRLLKSGFMATGKSGCCER